MVAKIILASLPILFAGVASAQSVGGVNGSILVNRGSGFVPLSGNTRLHVGDKIMAQAGGHAVVNFPDGCKVEIVPGKVVAIGSASPCALAQANNGAGPSGTAGPTGGGGLPPSSLLPIAGIVGATGAATALFIATEDDNNGHPVSP